MAETATEPLNYTPGPNDPNFASTAGALYGQQIGEGEKKLGEASDWFQRTLQKKSEATKDAIEQYRAQQKPLPAPPQLTEFPMPPTRQLADFLSPVEGQSPQQTVWQMISALTMLGTGMGGLVKGDARAAMASLTGALTGWQQGQADKAARAFADWQANTDTLIRNTREKWENYYAILDNRKLSNAEMMNELHLKAAEYGDELTAAMAAKGDAAGSIDRAMKMRDHLDQVEIKRQMVIDARDAKERHDRMIAEQREADRIARIQIAGERIAAENARRAEREQDKREQDQAVRDAYPPEVLEQMGREWVVENKRPTLGGMRSGVAAEIRGKAYQAGLEWARQNGIDPNTMPAVRAEAEAARRAIADIDKRQSQIQSFINFFDKSMSIALEQARKVDKTGVPIADRYYMWLRNEIAGDPETAKLDALLTSVAMEFAKVQVGTAQGDASTRAHARELINSARTLPQLESIFSGLKAETSARRESFNEEKRPRIDFLKNVGGGGFAGEPSSAGTPSGGWGKAERVP